VSGLSLAANAAKEVFEETGLLIEVGQPLIDTERTASVCRYFLGQRIGGDPSNMGWEAQAVCLTPVDGAAA
jgi:8-oxo-dGTP pyrophosphatase MutT (NUDIX family)